MADRVTIDRLGASGDGVADTASGPVYVPDALPGEVVEIEREGDRGRVSRRETDSPDRVQPFCPYFGRCGGCSTQHVGPTLYRDWKRGKLMNALARAGLDVPVEPLADVHGEGRRRVVLHAREIEGRMRVGFMAARSHQLVEIECCPITVPALGHVAPKVGAVLAGHLKSVGKPLDIVVSATERGLDVDLRGTGSLSEKRRQALIAEAGRLGLARLSVHGEVLIELEPPTLTVGRARLKLPPGGFLQATRAGEAALAEIVTEACGPAKRVADLFAGSGAFALRLAERAEVHAFEFDEAALAALDGAARTGAGLRRVTTERRDLFRRPLLGPELARFDAVVLDPPRAGAEAQTAQLARAAIPLVAMVSCDPGTFARDAAALVAGGYRLERVTPVDQFKWTGHLELVGIFRRPKASRRVR